MLIRSQDKKTLININYLTSIELSGNDVLACFVTEEWCPIGVY